MASRKEYEALARVINDLQHYGQEGSPRDRRHQDGGVVRSRQRGFRSAAVL